MTLIHTTFLIPLRIDSSDRLANARIVVDYLLRHTAAEIIILESGPASHQHEFANLATTHQQQTIRYIFRHTDNPIFHRTKLLNDMLDLATTPVVVNYDTDVLLPLQSLIAAEQMIVSGYDVVHPFTEPPGCFFVDIEHKRTIHNQEELLLLQRHARKADDKAGTGLSLFFSKRAYIAMAAENEEFISWAPEDFERMLRIYNFGLRYGRVSGPVYHLEHQRLHNSASSNPYFQANNRLYEKLVFMDDEPYKYYYDMKNIVTVYVQGGLGNRLFMVAMGIGYASKWGKTFAFVKGQYENENVHSQADYIQTFFAGIPEVNVPIDTRIKEVPQEYSQYKDYPGLSRNVLFTGYFQNEGYFRHCQQRIREQFRCPEAVAAAVYQRHAVIDFRHAFFIHWRVQTPGRDGVDLHGIPVDKYMERCVAHLKKRLGKEFYKLKFLFFSNNDSDEHRSKMGGWATAHLTGCFTQLIDEPDETLALWTMSLCRRGGLVLNSSLGWWASWLNDNPDKIVYMPQRWLNNTWPSDMPYEGVTVLKID